MRKRTKDEPAPKLAPESRRKSIRPAAASLSWEFASRPSGTGTYWRWISDHQRLRKSNPLCQGHRETPAVRARSIRPPPSSTALSPFSFFSAKTNPTKPFQVCSLARHHSGLPSRIRLSVRGHAIPPERFILRRGPIGRGPRGLLCENGRAGACRWKRVTRKKKNPQKNL